MPRRVVTEPAIADAPLRPSAGPASVFGASSAGSDLAQIAQAFGALSPTLARMGQQIGERKAQSATIAGEEAARVLEQSKLDYHEAIKRGLIEPNDSPWFRYGLKKQGGINAALRYQRELTAAVQDLPEEASLADFESFEREWFKEWSAKNIGEQRDEAFVQGFAASAAQARQGIALAFASRQNQAALKLFEEGLSSRLGAIASGLAQGAGDAEYADAAEKMNAILTDAESINPRIRSRLTELVTGVLYSEALVRGDTDLYAKLTQRIKGGTGRFDQITSVKLNLEKLTGEIIQNEARDREVREVREKERKETAYQGALVEFATAAKDLKRWDLVNPEPFAKKLEDQGMIEEADDLRRFALTRRENMFAVASQTVYKGLVYRAIEGNLSTKEVARYIGTLTPEQTITLSNLMQSASAGRGTDPLADAMESPIWKAAISGVKQTIVGLTTQDPTAGISEPAIIGSLVLRYQQFVRPFAEKGTRPTESEVAEFLNNNLEATIEENAGKRRNTFMKMYRDAAGATTFSIKQAPRQPTQLSPAEATAIGNKVFRGMPLTPLERRTLQDAMPDVDLDDTTELKRRLTAIVRGGTTNTKQP